MDGLYKGAEFKFTVNILPSYPYEPPKVTCETLVRFFFFASLLQHVFPFILIGKFFFSLILLYSWALRWRQVYHPNIDFEGHVCLNILRQDWTPVLNLNSVLFGLMTLFLEPNPDDPLNKEAAKLMIEKPSEFERNVRSSLRGGYVAGRQFPKLIN